jgi:hypothetical protein
MLKKILLRGLLAVVIVVGAAIGYYVVAGVDVVVTATGCGAVQPPVSLPLTWRSTPDGGVAHVPPLTVRVDSSLRNGQETLTLTGPGGLNTPFTIGSNVVRVAFDGTPLYQRAPGTSPASTTFNLGQTTHHQLVLLCR